MLISKTTPEITVNSSNYKHFKELGYDVEDGVIWHVPLEHVMKNSHVDVSVECDKCHTIKVMMFKTYNKYEKGKYFCRKCAEVKRKATLMKNHKVEYPAQSEKIKEKIKETLMEKYGYDNISKVPEFKKIQRNHNKKKKSL